MVPATTARLRALTAAGGKTLHLVDERLGTQLPRKLGVLAIHGNACCVFGFFLRSTTLGVNRFGRDKRRLVFEWFAALRLRVVL